MAHIHPPKVELFDVAARTNTDPKGFVRAVDEYVVTPHGLYLDRPLDAHPSIAAMRSWLLPELSLRVTDFAFHPGHERDQDFYLDVAAISRPATDDGVWRTEDHYLDLVLRTGHDIELVDVDELFAAVGAGLLDAGTAERAVATAVGAVDGLARHGYHLDAWLETRGVPLSWINNIG